jgi:hypothetical protein
MVRGTLDIHTELEKTHDSGNKYSTMFVFSVVYALNQLDELTSAKQN